MFLKSTHLDTEQQLGRFIRNAGYKRPTPLQSAVLPLTTQGRDIIVEAGPGEGRTGLFIISLLMAIETDAPGVQSLVLTSAESEVQKVIRQFRRFSARTHDKPYIAGLGTGETTGKELQLLARRPGIVVGTTERLIDHIRRENISLAHVRQVVLVPPEDVETTGFDRDVLFIYSKLSGKYQTQVYTSRPATAGALSAALRRPIQVPKTEWCPDTENGSTEKKENSHMSGSDTNKAIEDYIKTVLKRIKEDENPEELNAIRSLFRKNIPLHSRAYVSAFLLREAAKVGGGSTGDLATLFISIGKNRKVFPKDLNKLFSQELGLKSSDIGTIKILDNYSFVDISESYAQRAIDKLNGTEVRGRKITVNFARKKEEK